MIPIFPNFKNIELNDLEIIEKFTNKYPPYNDFEFTSLWTYNTNNSNTYSSLNNNLVIKIQDFISGNFFYSFLGTNDFEDTASVLLTKSINDDLGPELKLVPEINLKSSNNTFADFSIEEDQDNFDYILSVDEVASLAGGKYYDKRNLINRFKRLYPNHRIDQLDIANQKTKQEIRELFILWEKQKGMTRQETQTELIAIEKLFDLIPLIKIYCIGIYIDDKLIGFSTYHIVQNNYAVMSFEKGSYDYEGIYAYLNHLVAKHLKSLGSLYINYEQDLGLPGLKKAKLLWRPINFLKKYIIKKNE